MIRLSRILNQFYIHQFGNKAIEHGSIKSQVVAIVAAPNTRTEPRARFDANEYIYD